MSEPTSRPEPSVEPDEAPEKPWWDDPNLPWSGKPTSQDYGCWAALTISMIYGLVLLPFKPWLLTYPFHSAWISGGQIAMVAVGAITATRPDPHLWWLWALLVASVSVMKFQWIFWWAGKLWGSKIIDTWKSSSPRLERFLVKIQSWTATHPVAAVALAWVPFLPGVIGLVILATLGASKVSLRRFLLLNWVFALLTRGGFMYLGFRIGEPAVKLLDVYSKYALWLSLALLAFVLWQAWRKAAKPKVAP